MATEQTIRNRSPGRGGAPVAVASEDIRAERLPSSALKVLEGAVRVLGRRGMSDLSIESVCKVSGVSRATLYRYFPTRDDLLDAVFEFICVEFENGVTLEAARHEDPVQRFAAVMEFLPKYTAERGLIRIFEADPSFHLVFFRSHFARHRASIEAALNPVFDWIEAQGSLRVSRAATADRLIRLQISSLLIPQDAIWSEAWNDAVACADRMMEHWIVAQPTPSRPKNNNKQKNDNNKRIADGNRSRTSR